MNDEAITALRNHALADRAKTAKPAPVAPFLYPLFEHMQREHGLTLLGSELEEIRHLCRQLETTAAEQAADRANTEVRRGT